eukprot:1142852-Pelagomonas_calceolata.AAC.3
MSMGIFAILLRDTQRESGLAIDGRLVAIMRCQRRVRGSQSLIYRILLGRRYNRRPMLASWHCMFLFRICVASPEERPSVKVSASDCKPAGDISLW